MGRTAKIVGIGPVEVIPLRARKCGTQCAHWTIWKHEPMSMPIAEHIASRGLALPLYPQMRDAEADDVARILTGVLDE